MIIEYHRPDTLEEALELLVRANIPTVPLGGGTFLNQPSQKPVAVVDLQSLGLNTITIKGKRLEIGATVTLQQMLNFEADLALNSVLHHEATYNIRQVATVVGTLIASDGRSPFATAMLALDAELAIQPNVGKIPLGSYLPFRDERKPNHLITSITIQKNIDLSYEYVARTPADRMIVCAVVARWPSGRTRVALGGFGVAPVLAMDGPESEGAEQAALDAYREAGDQWASAEYRSDVAGVLVRRCIQAFS